MYYLFFSIILAFICQTQVLPIFGIKLDLFLFVTLYYGFLYGPNVGAGVGILTGLFQDVFSGGMLGVAPVGMIIVGFLAGQSRKILLLRYWFIRIVLVFVFTLLNMAIYLAINEAFFDTRFALVFKDYWFSVSIGNTVFAGIMFWLADRYA
jgi:rod shape-determining protein MreD